MSSGVGARASCSDPNPTIRAPSHTMKKMYTALTVAALSCFTLTAIWINDIAPALVVLLAASGVAATAALAVSVARR